MKFPWGLTLFGDKQFLNAESYQPSLYQPSLYHDQGSYREPSLSNTLYNDNSLNSEQRYAGTFAQPGIYNQQSRWGQQGTPFSQQGSSYKQQGSYDQQSSSSSYDQQSSSSSYDQQDSSRYKQQGSSPYRQSSSSPYSQQASTPYKQQGPLPHDQQSSSPYKQPGSSSYNQQGSSSYNQQGSSPYRQQSSTPYNQQGSSFYNQQGSSPYKQQQGSSPYEQPASTPYNQQASTPYNQQASTPYNQQASTPYKQQASTPYNQQGSSPYKQQQGSSPYEQPASTPYKQQGNSPYNQHASTPSKQQASTPNKQQSSSPYAQRQQGPSSILGNILPLGRQQSSNKANRDQGNARSGNRAASPPSNYSPLYRYGSLSDEGEFRHTEYFTTVAYSKFVYSLGHPWCVEGFGDAFTMAVTQLLKSEVSVMLSNTAAGLDANRSEMLFNPDDRAFEVVNRTGQYQPGLKNTSVDDIPFPQDAAPRNSVTWPVLLGIISKLFDDSRVGQKLRSVTDLLCQLSDAEAAVQPLEDNVYFCFMEDIVGSLLICGESEQAVDCKEFMADYPQTKEDFPDTQCVIPKTSLYSSVLNSSITFQDPNLRLPILFVDLLRGTTSKMLPRKVPNAIVEQESLTYLALFRGLMIVSAFSRVPFLCGAEKIRPPILFPGWDLPFVLTAKEEGDPIWKETGLKRDSVPIVFVSQSQDQPCAFVIAVRGTASMFEWSADFEYGQAPFALDGRIQAHKGFLDMMNVFAPVIDDFLKRETARRKCTCEHTHLIFTGHSLGAGVSQLLALYFADKYGIQKCGVDVSGAFFAPPRVFNYAGSQKFRQIVNGRIVLDIGDGLSYMPCYDGNSESGWPRCSRGHMPTPGEGRDYYADNYALVEIEVDFTDQSGGQAIDAFMQSIFPSGERNKPSTLASLLSRLFEATIPGLNQVPSLGVLGAAHVCAFACKFSQDACGASFEWWCSKCPLLL